VFVLLLWSALNGHSVVGMDATTSGALATVLLIAALASLLVVVWIGVTSSASPAEERRTRTAARPV
jgi:hypothetical protein